MSCPKIPLSKKSPLDMWLRPITLTLIPLRLIPPIERLFNVSDWADLLCVGPWIEASSAKFGLGANNPVFGDIMVLPEPVSRAIVKGPSPFISSSTKIKPAELSLKFRFSKDFERAEFAVIERSWNIRAQVKRWKRLSFL